MKNKSTIMWGGFSIAAAVLVIANALHGFLTIWQLITLIALVPTVVCGIYYKKFDFIFLPLAVIGIIFAEELGITAVTPWPLIIAAVLLTVGFQILLSKQKLSNKYGNKYGGFETNVNEADENMDCQVKFGGCTKYFSEKEFRHATVNCDFGGVEVYFGDSTLHPDGAILNLTCNFGGVDLFIPKNWNVKIDVNVIAGAVDECGKNTPDPTLPTLTIVGSVNFGGVDITYV
ncbi:MAG: hypothetical protein FWF76_00480 [Oscillospiraceae bacterium]|nr:hypothetical protein [Oscillospiraceae bacterium]